MILFWVKCSFKSAQHFDAFTVEDDQLVPMCSCSLSDPVSRKLKKMPLRCTAQSTNNPECEHNAHHGPLLLFHTTVYLRETIFIHLLQPETSLQHILFFSFFSKCSGCLIHWSNNRTLQHYCGSMFTPLFYKLLTQGVGWWEWNHSIFSSL